MVVNDRHTVTIESLDHNGRGIARVNHIPIFIENALPGEKVEIKIINVKKKYSEGSVVTYSTQSKDRVVSSCPYFKECGGCHLLHMSIESQRAFKENKVKDILYKFAGLSSELVRPILFAQNTTFYRNKVTFKVKEKIGFFRKKSNKVIPIASCNTASIKANKILNLMRDYLNLTNIKELMVRVSETKGETMLVIKKEGPIDENRIINILGDSIGSIVVNEYDRYYTLKGNGFITEKLGKYTFKISPESFFQINTACTTILYDTVLQYCNLAEEETVLDLYCGTGTIGTYVSRKAKEVLGIESNRYAVLDALTNKKNNKVRNVNFVCKDVSKIRKDEYGTFGVIIVDPPRAGLDLKTIQFLIDKNPTKIVYVSCDPVTLARDLKLLEDHYEVLEVTPVDMFPGTYHVECVCLLKHR